MEIKGLFRKTTSRYLLSSPFLAKDQVVIIIHKKIHRTNFDIAASVVLSLMRYPRKQLSSSYFKYPLNELGF